MYNMNFDPVQFEQVMQQQNNEERAREVYSLPRKLRRAKEANIRNLRLIDEIEAKKNLNDLKKEEIDKITMDNKILFDDVERNFYKYMSVKELRANSLSDEDAQELYNRLFEVKASGESIYNDLEKLYLDGGEMLDRYDKAFLNIFKNLRYKELLIKSRLKALRLQFQLSKNPVNENITEEEIRENKPVIEAIKKMVVKNLDIADIKAYDEIY